MNIVLDHLIILPILLPLATGAGLLMFDDRQRTTKALINVASTALLLVVSIALVEKASTQGAEAVPIISYSLGSWPAPFGIILVLDRLAAMMVTLTAILGLSSLIYALARWHAVGPSFHSLFQFLLMGLSGAFLTGDIFNLFVFFEVMLAASYGLVLHGVGTARVKAGLHYIAVNLAASSLFLVGAALIYGVTGTLNMADLALKIADIPATDRGLLEAGAAILGLAFLIKAGIWPLGFWLPTTYAAASAPVAAIFTIMTKVGIYALLRLSTLTFGAAAGASSGFGQTVLLTGGLVTIGFGIIGILASQTAARLAGYCVLTSAGTLLGAIGLGNIAVTTGALFYLVVSTLAVSAFYLIVELLERVRIEGADVLAITLEAYGDDEDEEIEQEVGLAIPGALAVMGICFSLCVLLLVGFPPFAGFLAKFAMISAMFNPTGLAAMSPISPAAWFLSGFLVLAGFAALISLTRTGINTFWATMSDTPATVHIIEIAPIITLLALAIALTVFAGPIMDYMQDMTEALYNPVSHIRDVLATPSIDAAGTAS